jgi:hypothetical protein
VVAMAGVVVVAVAGVVVVVMAGVVVVAMAEVVVGSPPLLCPVTATAPNCTHASGQGVLRFQEAAAPAAIRWRCWKGCVEWASGASWAAVGARQVLKRRTAPPVRKPAAVIAITVA